jgi:hypothetical protein
MRQRLGTTPSTCRRQGGHDVCGLAGSPGADASTFPSRPRCGPCPPCRARPRGTGRYVSGSIHAALRTQPGPEPLIRVGDRSAGRPARAGGRLFSISARAGAVRLTQPRVASRRLHLLADDRRSTAVRGFMDSLDTASGNGVRRLRLHRACPLAVLVLAVLARLTLIARRAERAAHPFARAVAPRVGLEPTTLRLTAGCSAN